MPRPARQARDALKNASSERTAAEEPRQGRGVDALGSMALLPLLLAPLVARFLHQEVWQSDRGCSPTCV